MVDVVVLVKDRAEFTAFALDRLAACTDFSLLRRLLFVNDASTDGADDVCRAFVQRTGRGEVVDVQGGSVTNALFLGTATILPDPPSALVKLDNDFVVCPGWLEILLGAAARGASSFDVVGMSTANDFFTTPPEQMRAARRAEDYELEPTAYTGGNFLMQWSAFARFRALGVTEHPANYVTGSISEIHRRLSIEGRLRCCVLRPHLPVFKLDKALDTAYEAYRFPEEAGLDRTRLTALVREYAARGVCRKDLVAGRIVNRY